MSNFCVSGGEKKQKKRLQSNIDPDRMMCYLAITPESVSVTFPSEATERHGATGGDSGRAAAGGRFVQPRQSRLSRHDMHRKARPGGGARCLCNSRKTLGEFILGLSNNVSGNLPD